jgi:hypothetical protein
MCQITELYGTRGARQPAIHTADTLTAEHILLKLIFIICKLLVATYYYNGQIKDDEMSSRYAQEATRI